MTFPEDQIVELKGLCPEIAQGEEGGQSFLLLPKLPLPPGSDAANVDALLCPYERDGYASRLYFARQVGGPRPLNWNAFNVRILNRNWYAHSWRVRKGLRLAQMLGEHMIAFRAA
ncbi:MAG: hypothetical protein JNN07_23190 [Verrucomicrobiales bacterium]|nr:hypothetical protein [Verrucomicrobiales bacterium]